MGYGVRRDPRRRGLRGHPLGRRAEVAETVNTTHTNPDYLPGIELPASIRATTDPAEALLGAEFAFLVVPSQTLRANLADWAPHLEQDTVLVS